MRDQTCCFAGCRPEKLWFNPDQNPYALEALLRDLHYAVEAAIAQGYTTFISGMCYGFDLWAAEIVLELREQHPITLVCAVPYDGQSNAWSEDWVARYNRVLFASNAVHLVSDRYEYGCYHKRNRFMVDHASLLIALQVSATGGTAYTVHYAKQQGIEVQNLLPLQLALY